MRLLSLLLLMGTMLNSTAQKSVKEHVLLLFPKGPSTDVATFDTTFLPEYDYFSYSFNIGDGEIKLLEGKIYKGKKGKRYLLIIEMKEDMQCSWYNEYFYEIDKKTDSLKKLNFDAFHDTLTINHYTDTTILRKEILTNYKEKLKEYLGDANLYENFFSEYYDISYYIEPETGLLTSYLHICNYIPTNICGFEEDEIYKLRNNRFHLLKFDKKLNRFIVEFVRIKF